MGGWKGGWQGGKEGGRVSGIKRRRGGRKRGSRAICTVTINLISV